MGNALEKTEDFLEKTNVISQLDDVKLRAPRTGQALVYDATESKWKNATIKSGGGGGSEVVANPPLEGDEENLTALEVDGEVYKVPTGGGGGNADKVELTRAEYEALPDTKLTDGKMYFIKDWDESSAIDRNIYDDTERVIGEYFGKPLYRKVVKGTISSQGFATAIATDINAINSRLINLYGFVGDLEVYRSVPNGSIDSGWSLTTSGVTLHYSEFYRSLPYEIVLEYIKVDE